MSDEIPETPWAATRNLLGAVGFILILLGGEILVEKTGERFWLGVWLVIVGIPIFFIGVFWRWLQQRLAKGVAKKLNFIASDPIWWVALLSVFAPFSFTQFGLLPTAAALVPLGVAYAIFAWRKADKATATKSGMSLELVDAQWRNQQGEQTNRDILCLLDFGVYQTTLVMLSELVDRIPSRYFVPFDDPLPLEFANQQAYNDSQVYLQLVRNRINDGSDRAARYASAMRDAENLAVSALRQTPQESRPEGIDPLILRDYAISYRQAVFTAGFLRGEKQEIEKAVISQRAMLIERFGLRKERFTSGK